MPALSVTEVRALFSAERSQHPETHAEMPITLSSETVEKGKFANRGLPYNLHFLDCFIGEINFSSIGWIDAVF
jgi:hypothetical protein